MVISCGSFKLSRIPVINPSLTPLLSMLRTGRKAEFFKRAVMAREAGAATLHLDVFDANYVDTDGNPSNIDDFNPKLAAELRKKTGMPIDVHFMVRPSTMGGSAQFRDYLSCFKKSADFMSIHPDAFSWDGLNMKAVYGSVDAIRKAGASPGIVINPDEGPFLAAEASNAVDFALAMTVIPGNGGRGFDKGGLNNISRLATMGFDKLIAADGAITGETIKDAFAAGARWFVVGSYWFGKEGAYKTLEEMRAAYQSLIEAAGSV